MARNIVLCPTCKTPVAIPAELRPASFPFCSDRCRMVDLGAWFEEEYVVPSPIPPDDDEAIAAVLRAREGEG